MIAVSKTISLPLIAVSWAIARSALPGLPKRAPAQLATWSEPMISASGWRATARAFDGQACHEFVRGLRGGGFVGLGAVAAKLDAQAGQQFLAVAGGRGEDKIWHGAYAIFDIEGQK